MKQKWSVKALVAYLKLKLDNDILIQNVSVIGEVSNFKYHNNRHMYFTLKDESSRINCVMFQTQAKTVDFEVKDGMLVNVVANVSIFESSGSLQLYVNTMNIEGAGDLAARFELLKQSLNNEGIFDTKYKKTFKKYPNRIAVVSGKDSAALNDILTTLERRWPIATVDVYPTLVQGSTAHLNIIDILQKIDHQHYDVIILARGGGSIEDLWAFNEEDLARCIFALNTPIISGVGHEIDFTIADFVSDLRAPTPTAAAELISPDINEVKSHFKRYHERLIERINNVYNNKSQEIDRLSSAPHYNHPELLLSNVSKSLGKHREQLLNYKHRFDQNLNVYRKLEQQLILSANLLVSREKNNSKHRKQMLLNTVLSHQQNVRLNFSRQLQLLDSYSPINTIKRGYSIVSSDTKIIRNIHEVQIDESIKIKVTDGVIEAIVKAKESNYE